jgi:hypothetical protein
MKVIFSFTQEFLTTSSTTGFLILRDIYGFRGGQIHEIVLDVIDIDFGDGARAVSETIICSPVTNEAQGLKNNLANPSNTPPTELQLTDSKQ